MLISSYAINLKTKQTINLEVVKRSLIQEYALYKQNRSQDYSFITILLLLNFGITVSIQFHPQNILWRSHLETFNIHIFRTIILTGAISFVFYLIKPRRALNLTSNQVKISDFPRGQKKNDEITIVSFIFTIFHRKERLIFLKTSHHINVVSFSVYFRRR